jgi:hypothetical protein
MQQHPVRYYIVKPEDETIVRSVPVTRRPVATPVARAAETAPVASRSHVAQGHERGRTRVARLMRSAMSRGR